MANIPLLKVARLLVELRDGQMVESVLLPHAPPIPVKELVEHAELYARATGYPVQYQWTLMEDINDSDAEVERIAQFLSGKYAIMNFIPFNPVDDLPYRRPSSERIAFMVRTLKQQVILVRIRDSAGQEIEGACGQLRAREALNLPRGTLPIMGMRQPKQPSDKVDLLA